MVNNVPLYLCTDLSGTNSFHISTFWPVLIEMIENGDILVKQVYRKWLMFFSSLLY